MQYSDSLDSVVQECRFLVHRRDLNDLCPDLAAALPPMALLEYLEGGRESAVRGFPVVHSPELLRQLLRLLATELGRCLSDPDYAESVDSLTLDQLRAEPYHQQLASLLVRTAAHGEAVRLDTVLWLALSEFVAGLLSHHEPVLERLRTLLPEETRKAEKYLNELLRLKGSKPAQHAAVKNRVLRSLFARNDVVVSSLADVLGEAYSNAAMREMVSNRLIYSEKPGGLYSFFDLREIFHLRGWRIGAEDFVDLNRVLRGVLEAAYSHASSGKGSPAESYLVQRFATDAVLEKAGRLDIADASPGAQASEEGDSFSARVAWLLSLQPEVAWYVLSHLESFAPLKALGKRFELRKDFLRNLKTPASLAPLLPGYQEVCRALLQWDFLNALRSFVRHLTVDENGRSAHDGRSLRGSVRPLDLCSPDRLYSAERHGTVVAIALDGFSTTARRHLMGKGDEGYSADFAALCVHQLLTIRRNIGVFRGRPEFFDSGRVVDVFPRALDALRYVALFQASFERLQHVRPTPGEEPRANPFAHAMRAGLGTGEYVDLALPIRGEAGHTHPGVCAAGPLLDQTRELVGDPLDPNLSNTAAHRIRQQLGAVHDPLQAFSVGTEAGLLDNRGICSVAQTFREVVAAVRLEGLPSWTPGGADDLIAGRRVVLKNYRFELIFDDPATGRVVLARQVDGAHDISHVSLSSEDTLYEYVVMWPDAFQTFIDRVMDLERHQPDLRRSRPSAKPSDEAEEAPESAPAEGPRSARFKAVRSAWSEDAPEAQAADLNLPGEEDFHLPNLGEASELDLKLGLSFDEPLALAEGFGAGEDGLGWDVTGDLALPTPDDTGPAHTGGRAPDLGLLDAVDGLMGGGEALPDFSFDEADEIGAQTPGRLEAIESGRGASAEHAVGSPLASGEQPAPEDLGGWSNQVAADWAEPEPASQEFIAAPEDSTVFSAGGPDTQASAALEDPTLEPLEPLVGFPPAPAERPPAPPRRSPASGSSARPSLLGKLESDLAARIADLEGTSKPAPRPSGTARKPAPPPRELAPKSATAPRPTPRAPAAPARRPDFDVLFRDYVTFWVGDPADDSSFVAIGRRYRDVFFDLHRFERPPGATDWGRNQAVEDFLRKKRRDNFVPQSLAYEEKPPGAGSMSPLEVLDLDRAWLAIS